MIIEKPTNNLITPEPRAPEKKRKPLRGPAVPFTNDIISGVDIIEHEAILSNQFHGGSSKRSGLKLALWSWLSASIDGLEIGRAHV